MAKMIFAKQKDTGKIVSIAEVESGLKCNCVCPHCGDILEARKGKVRAHHFAHSYKDETIFCSESALHLAAKEILKEERNIALPSLKIGDDINHKSFEILHNGYEFNYNNIEIEKSILVDGAVIRPDVIVENDKATLAIEILVSHAVDDEKKEKIQQARLTTIEIDLNVFNITSKEELKRVLLVETSNKKWIFSNQAEYFSNRLLKYCKKLLVQNSYIKNCPINVWKGRQFDVSIHECNGCKYGYGVNLEYVLCLGDKRISDVEDFKSYVENPEAHIKNCKMKEVEKDKDKFMRGLCPVCNSFLRVGNAEDPYIVCWNFKACKFTASIDLIKYSSCFKDRYGETVVAELPEFVLDGVLQLQRNAKEELESIENVFSKGICPYCVQDLIIRKGKYGLFLGCKGYSGLVVECKFKAKIDLKNKTATFQTRHSPKQTIVKPIPESVIRAYNKRQQIQQRTFQIGEKDRRED